MGGINQDDFKNIFNLWYEPVRNFLYYKTGDMQAAEDLTHDAFLKIWEKRTAIKIETVKSLLFRIANNSFLNRLDHHKVILKFSGNYKPELVSESPEFEMEVKEFDKKLQDAINGLDNKKRIVFLMNRVEKFTYKEIAESQGITVKAVEKRMAKALAYLKKNIEINI
jgi:RNA polymerase sigma-70 factor (family 1)